MDEPKRTYVGRVTKKCEKCDAAVTRKASAFKDHVFCSRDCYLSSDYLMSHRDASNARRYEGRRAERPCFHCGKPVERAVSQFKATVYCSRTCKKAYTLRRSHRQIRDSGYAVVFVGTDYPGASSQGHIFEHRKIMQDMLGRPLTPDENVHHKNGVRDDNRVENLELWTRSQPSGQRVADKVAWARDLLALYEGLDL